MNEKKAKELTDSIFNKLNDQERVYLAWIHNQKNKEIERLNNIMNESAEEILKELEENNHLSYGVALAIRQKLLDYKELKVNK